MCVSLVTPEVTMAGKTPAFDGSDRKFVDAWDAEIDAQDADDRALRKEAHAAEIEARARRRTELAPISAKLLQAAGSSSDEAQRQADEEFARVRKTGAARRARALDVLKKRLAVNAADAKDVIAGVKRGQ
jgi:hypothetical protein